MTDPALPDRPERADYVLAAIPLFVVGGVSGGVLTTVSLAVASGLSLLAATALIGFALFVRSPTD